MIDWSESSSFQLEGDMPRSMRGVGAPDPNLSFRTPRCEQGQALVARSRFLPFLIIPIRGHLRCATPKRITSFQRPSKNLNACSTPVAAVAGVCLFAILEGEYLTFSCVLAIS
jgi:hypothetical protein